MMTWRATARTVGPFALLVVVLLGTTAAVAAPGQLDPQVAAIQTVIQTANQEQAQALASGDPSVMSDTATAAYYRQLMETNAGLAARGATRIELIQLNFGSISIEANTATATTSETWITTFSDGTTLESTDTNVYSLVNQAGTWLIAADMHPSQPTPGLGGPPPMAQPTPQAPVPMVPAGPNTSHNWSGYAATDALFTGVTGTWTVPHPNVTGGTGIGATWVGIGGVLGRDLIQAGTQDATPGGGQAEFQAWIELLPQPSQQVPLAVAPGDSVTVSIDEQGTGSGNWQISMTNNTSGQTFQTTVSYASSHSSAEWIEEAPSGAGGILPLDNFNLVAFSEASASQDGQTVTLGETGAQPITLLNATNQPLAVPSPIGSDGASFQVTRTTAPSITARASGR
jgi:Peptidase A4 family